ncbi:PREDICTED: kelch repeat and BTB domain-containing protein 8-like [Branchiostoma belcheri]|uniref:Kelch repeat and BTB domain-containing protein 8-like n=1 Tax=Branchiostoma belcheri TaxID=7741 RepID=A0A6P4ZTF3_BRABE|nr:PREDICTED: kelch repeat and BTB domain-containing protein 8-like [Branchiostoma belcheri]
MAAVGADEFVEAQAVTYSNPKHFSGFFAVLKNLQADGGFQDVTLEVCGRLFPSHRLVLAGVSPYFRTLFSVGLQDDHVSVQEPCLDPNSIQSILQYAYSGELQLATDELEDIQRLAVAAKFLQVDFVCETCAALLEAQLDTGNVVQTFLFAVSNDIEKLRVSSKAFICRYFPRVSMTEGFKDLSPDQFLDLISGDELDVKSETMVWEAAASWVQSDESARSAHLPEILQKIRFPLLTQADIEIIKSHKLISEPLMAQIATHIQPNYESEGDSGGPPEGSRKRYGMTAEEMLLIFGACHTDSAWEDLRAGRLASAEELDGTLACYSPLTREVYSMSKPGDTCPAAVVATPSGDIYAIYTTSAPRFLQYDHFGSCWVERAAPLMWPRHPRELICSHGCLYLFSDDDNTPVQQYQPKVNQWFKVASVSLDDDTVCVSLSDRLYAIGPERTMRYDHNIDSWESLNASLRGKLDGIANAVSCGGRIFCIDYDLTKMMSYNPARDKWKTATSELPDCSYFHLVVSESRDELFGLASRPPDPDQPLVNKFLYRYNQGAHRWEHLLDIPNRLSVFDTYCCLAARMYPPALGGGDDFPDLEESEEDSDGGSHDDDEDDDGDDDDQNEGPSETDGQ